MSEIKTEPIETDEGYLITEDMTFADIIRFLIDQGCDKEEAMVHYEYEEKENNQIQKQYKEYSAWCHDCSRPFVYYFSGMDEPDWECPRCNSDKYVTVP